MQAQSTPMFAPTLEVKDDGLRPTLHAAVIHRLTWRAVAAVLHHSSQARHPIRYPYLGVYGHHLPSPPNTWPPPTPANLITCPYRKGTGREEVGEEGGCFTLPVFFHPPKTQPPAAQEGLVNLRLCDVTIRMFAVVHPSLV
ncbi:hypothetical protein E2C01_080416 [Portunus trituberculatus]|uniref:Uncharacterized protein n=1 Tax=Portunus trituberculatus TaxID=210409 RepID=A0A5B7IZK2_PORTR|nr:hypothetical protein [Portunus trituberculatus]